VAWRANGGAAELGDGEYLVGIRPHLVTLTGDAPRGVQAVTSVESKYAAESPGIEDDLGVSSQLVLPPRSVTSIELHL
jgi:hypothetical protein